MKKIYEVKSSYYLWGSNIFKSKRKAEEYCKKQASRHNAYSWTWYVKEHKVMDG